MTNEIPETMDVGFAPAPGSPWPKEYEIESSKAGTFYKVEVHDENGFATCTCKGFSYRQRCRHTKEARERCFGVEAVAKQDAPTAETPLLDVAIAETPPFDVAMAETPGDELPARSKEDIDAVIQELWG